MRLLQSLGNMLASPGGLFIHISLLLATTAFLIYKPLTEFHTYDKGPQLLDVPADQIKHVPEVEVGFSLENFSEFDVENNNFHANGVVWFIYDPKEIELDKIGAFSFKKTNLTKSTPIIHPYGAKMLARYFVRLEFTSTLDYHDFPLDDHHIFLSLTNELLSSKAVRFVSSKRNVFVEPDHLHFATWKLVDYDAQAGYDKITLKERQDFEEIYYPNVVFSFSYGRVGIHLITLILIPLLFIFFVALSLFLLQSSEPGDMFSSILFALVGYLFVLQTITPPAGYLILSDYVYFAIFICSFFITTLSFLARNFSRSTRGLMGTAIECGLIALLFIIFRIWR